MSTEKLKKEVIMGGRKWTVEEIEYVRKYGGRIPDKEIAERLSKISNRKIGIRAVRKYRKQCGLYKKPGQGKCELVKSREEMAIEEFIGDVIQKEYVPWYRHM